MYLWGETPVENGKSIELAKNENFHSILCNQQIDMDFPKKKPIPYSI